MWAFLKKQCLLVQRVKCFPRYLGLLLGYVGSIVQQVDLHIWS